MSDPKDCYIIKEGELVGMGEYPECFRSKQDADKWKEHSVSKAQYDTIMAWAETLADTLKDVELLLMGENEIKLKVLADWQKFREQL